MRRLLFVTVAGFLLWGSVYAQAPKLKVYISTETHGSMESVPPRDSGWVWTRMGATRYRVVVPDSCHVDDRLYVKLSYQEYCRSVLQTERRRVLISSLAALKTHLVGADERT